MRTVVRFYAAMAYEDDMQVKKAIILGASSGIGRELAKILSREGYVVGLAARRIDLLDELAATLPGESRVRRIDVAHTETAGARLSELIDEMGGVDLVVYSSGTGYENPELAFDLEKETIEVNVAGFTLCAGIAFNHFMELGSGHLVGISSIAALAGSAGAPAYSASKAYMSNYLQGLRVKARKAGAGICVTDIMPGFVDTPMAKGEGIFWMAPPETAARQILRAIKKRKRRAYVTRRWRLIAWVLRIAPDWLLAKF